MKVLTDTKVSKSKGIHRYPLVPSKSKIHSKNYLGFDIETYGKKNEFYMCSFVNDNMKKVFYSVDEAIKFINSKPARGYTCVATNLEFDILGLFKNHMHLVDLLERKGRFISVKCLLNEYQAKDRKEGTKRRHFMNFVDTMNYAPFSVKKLGEIMNIPKLPTPSFIGRKPKNDEEIKIMEDYNVRDSYVSYNFMSFLQKEINKLGAEMKVTLSSTAMDMFKREYLKYPIFAHHGSANKMIFNAYKGGRTEAFKRGLIEGKVDVYDVNSLYPSCMLEEYPNPNSYEKFFTGSMHIINNFEGIIFIKGFMPQHYIPSLAVRSDDKKLIFPVNNIQGWFSFNELRYAIEEQGFQINYFGRGIKYIKSDFYFKEMMEELYKYRMKHKLNKSSLEIVPKLLMNSCYGKFGYRYFEEGKLVHRNMVTENDYEGMTDLNVYGEFIEIIKANDFDKVKNYCLPIWACYTTAKARMKLNSYLINEKYWDNIVYCDTDSVFLKKGKSLPTGNKLGEMKLENTFKELIIIRPKMYGGDIKVTAKGLGKMDFDRFKKIREDNEFHRFRFTKYRTAVKSKPDHKLGKLGFNERVDTVKSVSLEDTKRWWFGCYDWDNEQDSSPIYS